MTRSFRTNVKTLHLLFAVAVFASVAIAQSAVTAASSVTYADDIAKITAGVDSSARGKAIETSLKTAGIEYKTESFTASARGGTPIPGTNIIASIPVAGAKRTIMIGAHLDKVRVGVGAIDNASGSAAVLELLRAFKARPMKDVTVWAGFWDLEEIGLVGSRAFVQSREKAELPNVYINFDVYGTGDTIWLWSADENLEFAKGFAKVAKDAKFGHFVSREYPPSDHKNFAVPGIESFSFSLGPRGEAQNVINVLKGKIDPANFPKALQIIHTENDTVDKIDPDAVVRSLVVIEAAIRMLDK